MRGKIIVGLMGLMVMTGQGQERHYLKHRLRIVGEARVDVGPLMDWWTNVDFYVRHSALLRVPTNRLKYETLISERPLTAWVKVCGTKPEVKALGWIVEATIEERPGKAHQEKIFVRHAPNRERAWFMAATGRSDDLREAQVANSEAAAKNKETARTAAFFTSGYDSAGAGNDPNAAKYRRERDEAARLAEAQRQVANQSAEERGAINAQLATFPNPNIYYLDFFALRTGEVMDKLPVYDLGMLIGDMAQ